MSLFKYILDVLFPRTCPVCGQVLSDDTNLCSDCFSKLDRTEQALNRDNETEDKFVKSPHFAYGGCWLYYRKETDVQRLIHKAKFGAGNPMLLLQLGAKAAMEWEETGFFDNIDIIVPIPLHPKRFKQRGFNQSEYIARGLSEVLNIPMDTSHLTRSVNNRKQSQSSKHEREQLAANLFSVNHPEEWYGKTILLVDDIITTGATIRTAMEALKEVYRCQIVVFALAKTQ